MTAQQEPPAYRQGPFKPPPGATEIILVRHGQSQPYIEGNPFPMTAGHGDPPLSPQGHLEAELVCSRLARMGIAAIYVSNLRRTAQTAATLVKQLGLDPRVDQDLREVHLGDWEAGLFRKMVAEGHPIAQQMFEQERWDVIPGAEPSEAFAGRVRDAIGRIAAAHPGERIAAFTHGGVIGQALALGAKSRRFAFTGSDNASISRLVITDARWIVRGFNDTAHLADAS